MTLAELRADFRATLVRGDVTQTQVTNWINGAIQRAQRSLNIPAAEKVVEITVANGFDFLSIPGDYMALIGLSVNDRALVNYDPTRTRLLAQQEGDTRYYVRDGADFVLGPRPRTGDVIRLIYRAAAPSLVSENDANWLSDLAPDIIKYGALYEAFLHFGDIRKADFENEFVKRINDLNAQARDDELKNAAVAPAFNMNFCDY